MNKIVLLDFCGTVIRFQTFDPFVKMILKSEFPKRYSIATNHCVCFFFSIVQRILQYFNYSGYVYKKFLVWLLRGLSKDKFEYFAKEYYELELKKSFIDETIEIVKDKIASGYRVIIVSGGCDEYIYHFARDIGITDIIASKFEIFDGKLTGRFEGLDCMGKSKIVLLNQYLKNNKIEGSFDICITDSISDKPLLNICKNKIIISNKSHQKWVENDLEEIIWD